jgi:mRNA-degrading endonuclease toxin of MazEF toxin-antitoxin module
MFNLFWKVEPIVSGGSSVRVTTQPCLTSVKVALRYETRSDSKALANKIQVIDSCRQPAVCLKSVLVSVLEAVWFHYIQHARITM